MKRVLIHIPMHPHGEYDIFSQYDEAAMIETVNRDLGGNAPNFGNRLWFQGLISAIECEENYLDYFSPHMTKEQINSEYDFIIAPMANVFSVHYSDLLKRLENRFRGIKIPVYVIACGIQADNFDQLDELVSALKEPASGFISSVYDTGGEFALRGYFTKEFFEKLGFPSAVATGCPSLFQMGRNLAISDEKIPESQFRPLFNGSVADYSQLYQEYENAVFFDQNAYFRELFNLEGENQQLLKRMVQRHGLDATKLILRNRIRLIPHMNLWREYLRQEGFSFSYGSRIHGSIMPILSGICTVLEHRDARTREMAEFFDIPHVESDGYRNYDSLYQLYQETSYKAFNEGFATRFDAYEQFLVRCGIVEKINQRNKFFYPVKAVPPMGKTLEKRQAICWLMEKKKLYWNGYAFLMNTKQKIRKWSK